MLHSLIPLDISLLAQVAMLGSARIAFLMVAVVAVANYLLTLLSTYFALRVSGNKHVVSGKFIAVLSLVMVIFSLLYGVIVSNFITSGSSLVTASPPFSEFFTPHAYKVLTQFGGIILLNTSILFFAFRKFAIRNVWLVILIAACINAPWFMMVKAQNESSYYGNNVVELSPAKLTEFKQNIVFSNHSAELASVPKLNQSHKTLTSSFTVTVAESGNYLLDMKIFTLQTVDEVLDDLTLRSTSGDTHGTYYINSIETDWYNSPNRIYFEQGSNNVTIQIPFVYTDKFSGTTEYNLGPISNNRALFGPYILFFQIMEYESEKGSIDLSQIESLDGIQFFKQYPSLSIKTQQFQQNEILLQ